LQREHVHMCLSMLSKYAVSSIVGYLKGKSAIMIAHQFRGRERNVLGKSFWARGYFVSSVGLDEAVVSAYIRKQDEEDARYEQMTLGI